MITTWPGAVPTLMIGDFSGRGCLSRCVWLGIRIALLRGFTPGFRGFSRFLTF